MINEAQKAPAGADGVIVLPSFFKGKGLFGQILTGGTILGCNLQIDRSQLFRALLEGFSFQLRAAPETL
jgi:L-fuculokinase